MKSKFLMGLLVLSFATGCNNTPQTKYVLRDTWGTNGDWGNNKQSAKVATTKATTPAKENKAHEMKKTPVKVATKAVTAEKPKNTVKAVEKKLAVASNEATKEMEKEVETVNTSVDNSYKWQKKSASGAVNAYYVKSREDENLTFSYGLINNAHVDTKFKTDYKKKLTGTFEGFKLLSDKDVSLQGKKAWEINYVFDKDGEKIQQKQVFIPSSKNVMVANFTATQKGFTKVEDEFKTITTNLKL